MQSTDRSRSVKKNSSSKVVQASWYDYPQYYDLAFRSETRPEADFIEAACRKYGSGRTRTLLEPACGTGRLVVEMASRGYRVTGVDLSRPALTYLGNRLRRRGLRAKLVCGDMIDYVAPRPVDAVFCTFNSFRHLLSEDDAARHLHCVAESLKPGGLYLLGMHLLPPDADPTSCERWTAQASGTHLTVTFKAWPSLDPRLEQVRVCTLARTRGGAVRRFRDEFLMRTYSAGQITQLLANVACFELLDVYDFWYDIDDPLELSDAMADTLFVLRKLAA